MSLGAGSLAALALPLALARAAAAPDPRVSVRMDPRVELENVLEYLAGPRPGESPEIPPERPEAARIEERFARFRSHPAVARYASARGDSFRPADRLLALFALSDPPELEPRRPLPTLPKGADVEGWLKALRRFARESDFAEFRRERERELEPELADLRAALEKGDWIRKLEAYAGLPFEGRLVFEISPARSRGLFESAMLPDGRYEVTCLAESRGPQPPTKNRTSPARFVWHEAGHALLDTLAELHADELTRTGRAPRKGEEACDKNRRRCVREHAVRAVMIRLVAREFGDEEAARVLAAEISPEVPHIAAMTEALRAYEKDRERWPSLAAFYPTWIEPLGPERDGAADPEGLAASLGAVFKTPGQRERAARWIEKELEGGRTPSLEARRDALRRLRAP